jgi:hypothetical protein
VCRRAKEISVTAGAIIHRSQLPLSVWFWAAYLMATHSNGISALQLQSELRIGSYETAWPLAMNLGRAMVAPGRSPLCGLVEIDEHNSSALWRGLRGLAGRTPMFAAALALSLWSRGQTGPASSSHAVTGPRRRVALSKSDPGPGLGMSKT